MLFNSVAFVLLVVPTLLLYYIPFMRRFQLHILVGASFIFYAHSAPWLLLLLIASMAINILASHAVVNGPEGMRKHYATLGVVLNLGILVFFKYSPLIGRTFAPDTSIGEFLVTIPLPVGISFFTFQGISLVVDAYRGKAVVHYRSIVVPHLLQHGLRISAYISFFAQLVAGPVVKAHDFMPQIKPKAWGEVRWNAAFSALVLGYFLKMVVADNLKDHTFWIEYPYFTSIHSFTLAVMLFGYSMQIFADFAGYSLIAIGLARLFGYELMANFNFPYISASFSEFWRRWHISLSTFLKEYLYVPLGGNRMGRVRTYRNLMLTMVLGGLWHGAAWSYAVWGFFHGLMLAAERLLKDKHIGQGLPIPRALYMLFVFSMVTLAWLLFKLPEFGHVVEYVKAFGRNFSGAHLQPALVLAILLFSIPVVLYHAHHRLTEHGPRPWIERLRPVAYGIMLFLILVNSGSGASFIYFQF